MNYELNFKDKVILVTGGSRGLGRAIAEGFAAQGGKVVLAARNAEKLAETKGAIEAASGHCGVVQADLSKDEDLKRMLDEVAAQYGRLDILVNNAGVGHIIPSTEVTDEQWRTVLHTNLDVPFRLSVEVAKRFFLPQGGGKIVNTDSMGGWTGIPCGAAYSASKGGLLNLTRSLATEWAKANIQVNCICPGYVETELIGPAMQSEQWMRLVQIRTPMARLGKAEEVVGAALFLASDLASFITGTYIHIDGGAYAAGF